jgi:hypothetical protein
MMETDQRHAHFFFSGIHFKSPNHTLPVDIFPRMLKDRSLSSRKFISLGDISTNPPMELDKVWVHSIRRYNAECRIEVRIGLQWRHIHRDTACGILPLLRPHEQVPVPPCGYTAQGKSEQQQEVRVSGDAWPMKV